MAFDEPNWNSASARKSHSKPNYSPSASFNYNGGNYQNQSAQSPSSRRRPDRNGKRHVNNNQNDRLVKQNDIIIRLLKEIRDRLPEPEQIAGLMEARDADAVEFSDQSTHLDNEE